MDAVLQMFSAFMLEHIYMAVGYTAMRKQIDGLSALVTANFKLDTY